ncbi:MAG: RNA methyltransferase [Microthrixaceae bacterium]|nr:RNA methyltransferase [Microthrixaceae bacterium]
MTPIHLTDPDDPRVSDFRRLNDTAFRRSVEAPGPFHKGIFIVEGWLAAQRLGRSRYGARAVLVDEARLERAAEQLGHVRAPVFAAPRDLLDEIVGFPLHRGVVASADRGLAVLASTVIGRGRNLVVCEGINDAENLGSVIRNAAALGGDGLLVDATTCDPLARRTVRVSVGWALRLPFARLALADGLSALHESGVTTVALTPRRDGVDIDEVVQRKLLGDRVAVILGAEGHGLSEATIDAATIAVRIPMSTEVDSLNVSAAAAVAMHRLFTLLQR